MANWILGILFLIVGIVVLGYLLYRLYLKRREKKPKKVVWYVCLDGHKVRSLGELAIDNALYLLSVPHEYEDYINKFKSNFKYDWYLPECNLYIEYFGYWTESYKKRRKQKVKFYQQERLKLLQIEPEDLANITLFLQMNLKRFGIQANQRGVSINWNSEERYCYNCGAKIENR